MTLTITKSGDSESRLAPLTVAPQPKQLLPVINENTFLQETNNQLSDAYLERMICHNEHRFLVSEQLRNSFRSLN